MSFAIRQSESPKEKARRERQEREHEEWTTMWYNKEETIKKAEDEFYETFDYFVR